MLLCCQASELRCVSRPVSFLGTITNHRTILGHAQGLAPPLSVCCAFVTASTTTLCPPPAAAMGDQEFTAASNSKKNSVVVKVGMVGDSQIGKTSLMVKYVEGTFDEDYIQTLGMCGTYVVCVVKRVNHC